MSGGAKPAALVTGAAKRVGLAIARDLADHGWAVVLHCNNSRHDAEAEADAIRNAGGEAAIVCADLTDRAAIARLIPEATAVIGRPLTLLVNNASVFAEDEVGSLEPTLWDAHMRVHVEAPVFLAEAFAAQLPEGKSGNVVNIIDQRVWRLTPKFFSYTLSKSALWIATRTLAQALAPRIRVNAIGPGPTLASVHQAPGQFDAQAAAVPLQTGATPEEIAAAVRFFVSSPSVTGQMLALDGGQHLAWKTPDALLDG